MDTTLSITHLADGTESYHELPVMKAVGYLQNPEWIIKLCFLSRSSDCQNWYQVRDWVYLDNVEYNRIGKERMFTTYEYDSRNRLISKVTPDISVAEEYLYDRNSNLRFIVDPNRAAVDSFLYYKYDALNRKIGEGVVYDIANFTQPHANDPNYPATGRRQAYAYLYDQTVSTNGKGRLSAEFDPNQTLNKRLYDYDKMGRITEITLRTPLLDGDKTLRYSYDLQGNVTEIEYPDLSEATYAYNRLGLIEKVGTPSQDDQYALYSYWPTRLPKQLKVGAPAEQGGDGPTSWTQTIDYNYTIRDWLKKINNGTAVGSQVGTGDHFGLELFYADVSDPHVKYYNGNIARMKRATSSVASFDYYYTYDNANRLLIADCDVDSFDVSGMGGSTMSYDDMGNILGFLRGSTSYEYSYGIGTNKVTSIKRSSPTYYYTYDANCNMKADDLRDLDDIKYDLRNLPKRFYRDNVSMYEKIECLYDAPGNRAQRMYTKGNIQAAADSLVTIYVYGKDGEVLAEYEGGISQALYLKYRYIYGENGERIGRLDSGGNENYFLTDHLGSNRVLLAESGLMKWWADYFPFGQIAREGSIAGGSTDKKFTGKALDSWTGEYYFGARYYDPEVGRFVSLDPLRDSFMNLSPYNYCRNNPLLFIDSDGKRFRIILSDQARRDLEELMGRENTGYYTVDEAGNVTLLEGFKAEEGSGAAFVQAMIENKDKLFIYAAQPSVTVYNPVEGKLMESERNITSAVLGGKQSPVSRTVEPIEGHSLVKIRPDAIFRYLTREGPPVARTNVVFHELYENFLMVSSEGRLVRTSEDTKNAHDQAAEPGVRRAIVDGLPPQGASGKDIYWEEK